MALVRVESDVEVFVQDVGEGPAVVIIPGFGMDHAVWDRQVREIVESGRRVLCLDQRGHGRSSKPFGDRYSIPRLALDLAAVLDAHDVRHAAVVGWSFGGLVALRFAAQNPKRVDRLVMVGSNGVSASRTDAFAFGAPADQILPALLEGERTEREAARRRGIEGAFVRPPAAALLDWLVARSLEMPSWAGVACYEALLRTDQTDLVDALSMPVRQVIGSNDPVASLRGAAWLQERLFDSRLEVLDGCGHYPMYEVPEAFASALRSALTD